jgi:shikimate dehydrogenase
MGSVNTLFWRDGKLWGTTSDPYGALKNLAEHGIDTSNRRIALLGNGGVARALAFALLSPPVLPECGTPNSVTLIGRNIDKLEALHGQLRKAGLGESPYLDFDTFDHFTARSTDFDLLINGTSVGMAPHSDEIPVDPESLHPGLAVYDIVYTPADTRLLREAKLRGCKTIPGIGMLIHQGALSFSHWFPNHKVSIEVMREAIERIRHQ